MFRVQPVQGGKLSVSHAHPHKKHANLSATLATKHQNCMQLRQSAWVSTLAVLPRVLLMLYPGLVSQSTHYLPLLATFLFPLDVTRFFNPGMDFILPKLFVHP